MKTQLIKPKAQEIIKVVEDTQYVLDLSNQNTQTEVVLEFAKRGVKAQIIALYFLQDNESFSLTTVAKHQVPDTTCLTEVKGVLGENAKSAYVGKIIIEKDAQQTSSYLDDSVLVIGKNTHNESQPILEIEADDVKASHGATTGRIDKSQLYYLQSRGLTEREAQEVIVKGFFTDLLGKINNEDVRTEIENYLLK